MMSNPVVVIPTYNEADNICRLVEDILERIPGIRVVVVDDNSPDGTGRLADELSERHPGRVCVIHREGKLGLGTAYISGIKYALRDGATHILTMDADYSHDPSYIPQLLEKAGERDVAIGSRYVRNGGTINWRIHRILLSWLANKFARIMLGLPANDCTSGFRCYRREVFDVVELESIRSDGYSFLVELLCLCHRAGLSIVESPIIFIDRKLGKSKISRKEIFKGIWTVFRLKLTKRHAVSK